MEERAARRTEGLRLIYPAGTTSREEVHDKWGGVEPGIAAVRPVGGWQAYSNAYVAEKVSKIEVRTEKGVHRVERFWGPDGLFSLCYCWFYYDARDFVVDVEWQYMSD